MLPAVALQFPLPRVIAHHEGIHHPLLQSEHAAVPANDEAMDAGGDDWRAQLPPEARSRIVNKILQTLQRCLPVSVPEGLVELQKIAVRFEEKMYAASTSQSDYLRKISLKLLSMGNHANSQQIPDPGSSSKGKKQKKLRCHFCKKGGHFKKDCLRRKTWFDKKGVAYDPTHKSSPNAPPWWSQPPRVQMTSTSHLAVAP